MEILRAGIFANPHKDNGLEGARNVAQLLRARGVAVSFDSGGMPQGEQHEIDHAEIDILFVLGGDGTLLKAAEKCSPFGVCMVGINLGRLGFLAEVEVGEIEAAIDAIMAGRCFVEERMMLHCAVVQGDAVMCEAHALNDVVVLKKDASRMIAIELSINGALADKVACDGMLVSTPTGSTGYALSAGGPVVSPQLECMVTTPICPHSLHSRSLVVLPDDEVVMKPLAPSGALLTTDGAVQHELQDGEVVRVHRSKHVARFVRFEKNYFYPLLRSKFISWDRFV